MVKGWQNKGVYGELLETVGLHMLNLLKNHSPRKWLILLLFILLLFSPIILYFIIFGPASGFSISRSDQNWANFGSYLSGTLGPLISICAFIGLFITIKQQQQSLSTQSKQLETLERQRVIDSIQENINEQCRNIDSLLHSKVNATILGITDSRMSLLQVIIFISEIVIPPLPDEMTKDEQHEELLKSEFRKNVIPDINRLGFEFNLLCNYWDVFISSGGHEVVINLQKRKYAHVLTYLRYCGVRYKTIDNHFDFNKLRELCINEYQFEDIWQLFDDER